MAFRYEDLPVPTWIRDGNELWPSDVEFPSWTEKDSLTFIIGQKYSMFPTLKELPRIREDEEVPDLYTIERRISISECYGTKEIIEDLYDMREYIKELYNARVLKRSPFAKMLRSAAELLRVTKEELDKFESCSDCVAHYYNTNDYFTVPCKRLHSAVYVKAKSIMWPAKTLRVVGSKVLVAYFGRHGSKNFVHLNEWVPFDVCFMAGVCFRHKMVNNSHLQALMEMGTYFQMIARKHSLYYKGYGCGRAVQFQPELLTIPKDILDSNPPPLRCDCQNRIIKSLSARFPKSVCKETPTITALKQTSDRLCGRIGCQKSATLECFFNIKEAFCSEDCSFEAIKKRS